MTVGFVVVLFLATITIGPRSAQSGPCKGVIHGVVIGQDGQPAAGMGLDAYPVGRDLAFVIPHTSTSPAGEYRFDTLCPGRYEVLANDPAAGYPDTSPQWYEFIYGPRHVQEVKLTSKQPEAELRVELPPKPGRLQVHLSNRETKADIPTFKIKWAPIGKRKNAWIEIQGDLSDRTDDVVVPPEMDFLMHVTADGFHEWEESTGRGKVVRIPSGTRLTLDVELKTLR